MMRAESVQIEVDRARRQYRAVEPENRLVARSLEREWEETLAAEIRVQADYERFLSRQPLPLSAAGCHSPSRRAYPNPLAGGDNDVRQTIARLMLDKVVVSVVGESEIVAVECHWAGGVQTQHQLRRTVQRRDQLSGYSALLDRIRDLHSAGQKAPAIAATLNAEDWHPPKRRDTFTNTIVRDLLHRQGVPIGPYPRPSDRIERNTPNATQTALPASGRKSAQVRQAASLWCLRDTMATLQAPHIIRTCSRSGGCPHTP